MHRLHGKRRVSLIAPVAVYTTTLQSKSMSSDHQTPVVPVQSSNKRTIHTVVADLVEDVGVLGMAGHGLGWAWA